MSQWHTFPILTQVSSWSTPDVFLGTSAISNTLDTEAPGFLTSVLGVGLANDVWNIITAIIILVVGWIIALIAKAIVKGLLSKTTIDNKVASWMTGNSSETIPIEEWIAKVVYWIVLLFAVIAALEALELQEVSRPLQILLNEVTGFLPKIGGALILLAIAWLIATLVKSLAVRALNAVNIDERLGQQVEETPRTTPSTVPGTTPGTTPVTAPGTRTQQFSLSETMGNTLYWFIFLLFLPAILNTLELEGTLEPVQELLNGILGILPNIFAAIIIGAIGWLVAQVVRRIVTNLLTATGIDQIGGRFGISGTTQSLSWILGTIVYVLILIPVAIAALNALEIRAISAPAVEMLEVVLEYLPQLFSAAIVLVLFWVAAQFISELVSNILTSIGFNNVFRWLGLPEPRGTQPTPSVVDAFPADPTTPPPSTPASVSTTTQKTPSEVVGIITYVAIMLLAVLTAVDILQIPALTALVSGLVVIAGQVLVALIIFAVGLYLANLAFTVITSSGDRQTRILGQAARVAIVALSIAMALRQIGIATSIVNLAFGLLLGAIAVAIALAFGLGSREIAAEQVRAWLNDFKTKG
ncbi:MAG: mechanosensitive ion channel [Jaaginema sp. PMC 1079.18]|nr:mechanosensitive ion channel [Jaaginema sp. PMC 1079.18]